MSEQALCEVCGDPMPDGETMFKFHGYSGPCPKPPLPKAAPINWEDRALKAEAGLSEALDAIVMMSGADAFAKDGVAGEWWATFRDERLDALMELCRSK